MNFLDDTFIFPNTLGMQREYNFEVFLPDLPGVETSGVTIGRFCQAVQCGPYTISELSSVQFGPFRRSLPDKFTIPDVKMTFLCTNPDIISPYFEAWRFMIIDSVGLYNVTSAYKKTISVLLHTRTGVLSNILKFTGAFPKDRPAYDLSYDKEGIVKFNIAFSVDDMLAGYDSTSSLGAKVSSASAKTGHT